MKLWKDERMGTWRFLTGAWHLTFLSSFIAKEAVNNHLAVGTITSVSIIAWRDEAGNFLRYHRGAGLRMGGVKKASCVQRNLKFNLSVSPSTVPHSRCRGSDLFCGVFVRERRDGKASGHIIECKFRRLWLVHWYWSVKPKRSLSLTAMQRAHLTSDPPENVGKTQWQQWRASPWLNPHEHLILNVCIHSKSL